MSRSLSRMPACWMKESSSEPREASGVSESNLVLYKRHGHLAKSTYPTSSTVVAKGLCQQDRKMKLLNLLWLPPAFQGLWELWESVRGCPGRAGNRNSRNQVQPPREVPQISQLLVALGLESSGSLGAKPWPRSCPSRYCPSVTGSTRGHKTLEQDMKQHHFERVVFVLSIQNVHRERQLELWWESAVWRSCVLFCSETTSLRKPALHFCRSLDVKNLSPKGIYQNCLLTPSAFFSHHRAMFWLLCFQEVTKLLASGGKMITFWTFLSECKTLLNSTEIYSLLEDSCKHIPFLL